MAAKVIAFINFKGGVGKTSNVVNLGAPLTTHKGAASHRYFGGAFHAQQ